MLRAAPGSSGTLPLFSGGSLGLVPGRAVTRAVVVQELPPEPQPRTQTQLQTKTLTQPQPQEQSQTQPAPPTQLQTQTQTQTHSLFLQQPEPVQPLWPRSSPLPRPCQPSSPPLHRSPHPDAAAGRTEVSLSCAWLTCLWLQRWRGQSTQKHTKTPFSYLTQETWWRRVLERWLLWWGIASSGRVRSQIPPSLQPMQPALQTQPQLPQQTQPTQPLP